MALPLKTGADLYNQQLIRARLQNLGAQPNTADVGLGQVYFNTGTNTAASLRIGYCYETGSVPKFHHVANLEDINRLDELISALSGSSSESVASVLGRVITLEGYFSNGKAKDADLLDGHNSDYFAEAATLNDLLEDYEAFKAVFSDNSDEYINTWTEVKDFLDGIKNTEDLNAILLGINTELGKKADKATTLAGYGITDAVLKQDYINLNDLATVHAQVMGYGKPDDGWKTYSSGILSKTHDNGFALQGFVNSLFFRGISGSVWEDNWHEVLHTGNYASVLDNAYLRLDGSSVMAKDALLKFQVGNGLYDWNARRGQGFGIIDYNTSAETPQYRLGFHIGGSHYRLDISHQWGANVLAYRIYDQMDTEVGPWISILDANNYSDLITNLNNNLNVPSITIGGIKLSVVEGQLQIDGDAFATGQLSSGGIGSEGSGSGASGIVILEDWEKYDDTLAQVLGAGLGVGLRDKIAALESKATKVSVSGLLESGKSIGTIKVDDTSYNLLAPDDYLPLSGGVIKGSLEKRLPTENATQNYILFTRHNGTAQGYLGFNGVDNPIYIPSAANAIYTLLHEGNYESVVGNKFLKLSGGTLTDSVMVNHSSGSKGYLLLTNGASIGGLVTNGTAVELFNVNGYGIGVEGTSDVYVLTNWVKKTMLHAGNYNSYAPTLTGTGASGTWGIDISGSAAKLGGRSASRFVQNNLLVGAIDANNTGGTTTAFYEEYRWSNTPNSTIGTLLETFYSEGWKSQFFIPIRREENKIYFRHYSSTSEDSKWSDWKTIAFTDSTVAAAKVLVAPATNEVVLSTNDNKRLFDFSNKQIYEAGASGIADYPYYQMFGDISAGASVLQSSKLVTLATGGLNRLWVNSSGNVTIGSSDLASTTWKLYVAGAGRFDGIVGAYESSGTKRTTVTMNDGVARVYGWDESSSAFTDLWLGNNQGESLIIKGDTRHVGIGITNPQYLLDVNGQIHATGQIYSDIGFILRTTDGKGSRASLSHSSNTLYIQSGYNDGSSTAGNMMISGVNTANLASFDVKANKSAFNGRLLVGAATDDGTTALQVHGDIVIPNYTAYKAYDTNGGKMNLMYLDTSNRLKVYNDIMSFTPQGKVGIGTTTPQEKLHVVGNLHVTGNIIADGEVSAGGVATEGTGGATGGSALDRLVFEIPANTTSFPCEHGLGTRDISVSIYEDGNDFQQVLADVYLDSTNVARIVFGAATGVAHKVVIIG